jgi:hypothetical protein
MQSHETGIVVKITMILNRKVQIGSRILYVGKKNITIAAKSTPID